MPRFDLVRPCPMCPFRTDCLEGWLGGRRASEIAREITVEQRTFSCHETTGVKEGEETASGDQQHCAGAAILLERVDAPNQMMRWMERIGYYDRDRLDLDAPVFESLQDFVAHHASEPEGEPCGVADEGCEAPAGYGGLGAASPNCHCREEVT